MRALNLGAREQTRQVARFAARLVHEKALEQRQALHRAQPGTPDDRAAVRPGMPSRRVRPSVARLTITLSSPRQRW